MFCGDRKKIKVIKVLLHKQSSAEDTQSVSPLIGRQRYDHTQCGSHLGKERGRNVFLCSSSLVLAWGQRCHCDSQVSQPVLENQAHKQIPGIQREKAGYKEGKWEVG